jgi:transposase, IS30 family
LRRKGYSFADIGESMDRATSAVWNEWQRNRTKGRYVAKKAQHKAYVRRRQSKYQGKKIVDHPDLKKEIVSRLKDGQRPGNIAHRITRREKHLPSISKDAIYRWLQSTYGTQVANWLSLHRKKKRRPRRGRHKKLEGRTFIEKRPHIADIRGRVGDVEFDFIVSGHSGKGILLTVVDRKIRKAGIEKILPVSIANVERAFLRIKKRFPEMKTATTDNDLLLQHHQRLEKLLGIKIYFCHPYHSWEKGSIEHVNGVIRDDIPKGSDISKYSKRFIRKIEEKINRKPMDVLDSFTPDEMFAKYRARKQNMKKRLKRRRSN